MKSSFRPRISAPSLTEAKRATVPSRRAGSATANRIDTREIVIERVVLFISGDRAIDYVLGFFVADDQVNHAVRRGHEEPIEIFSQLFDFIPPRDAVYFEK